MILDLEGKTAIVTGGSAGIGLACAKALFNEGAHVVIVARNEKRLKRAVDNIKSDSTRTERVEVIPYSTDLTQAGAIQSIVKLTAGRFKRIDILINNAGAARAGTFSDLDDNAFLDAWNLKLLGYIRMVKAVIPYMTEQRDGRIINIIGSAAHTPTLTFLPGSTANAALLNFTKGISKELIRYKIRINAISPGPTVTERAKHLNAQISQAKGISEQEAWNESIKLIPLGRMVKPSEIAALAVFLVSDVAAAITGSEIIIDGGSTSAI